MVNNAARGLNKLSGGNQAVEGAEGHKFRSDFLAKIGKLDKLDRERRR